MLTKTTVDPRMRQMTTIGDRILRFSVDAQQNIPLWVTKLDPLSATKFPDNLTVYNLLADPHEPGSLRNDLVEALREMGLTNDEDVTVVLRALMAVHQPTVGRRPILDHNMQLGELRTLNTDLLGRIDGLRDGSTVYGSDATRIDVLRRLFALPNFAES